MRKEILFAIIAGGAIGLLVAFGVWKVNFNLKGTSTKTSNAPTPTSTTSDKQEVFKIILEKPVNKQVITETPVLVSGITKPNTYVVVSGENGDGIMNSSASGSFNSNVDLTGGANQIGIMAFDTDGNSAKANLTVIYSGQYTQDASNSAQPQAYIGTVTDISNSVIQIKNDMGDIEQISGTANASYIDTRNNTTKQIKATDVAIGDYLIAMGIKDGNNILTSSRLLVTDPLAPTKRTSFYGVVTDDSGTNKFVAKNPKTNETLTITPATGITILGNEKSFGKISNNEKVIVAGELKDGIIAARTIEVIK